MDQIHKRFTTEQIKVLLQGYCQGTIQRACVEETLGIGKTRFFTPLKDYRQSSKTFSPLTNERRRPSYPRLRKWRSQKD